MIKPCFVSIQGVFLSVCRAIKDLCVLFFVNFFFFLVYAEFGLAAICHSEAAKLRLRLNEMHVTGMYM